MDQNEILHDPRPLGVTSSASKMISELTVHWVQTVHLSWMKISTVSKRTETSFHLSLDTQEYHPAHPKQFLSLWYVWCKPCTYHAPKLTLSPKGPNEIPHDPCHLGVPLSASKRFLWLWYVWCKLWIYLAPRLTLSLNGRKWDSTWPTTPRSSIEFVQNDFRAYGTFGANCAPILNQD
jgi:hypothetical protein